MPMQTEEMEQPFVCPYCGERDSLVVDLTEEGEQRFVQDCEVCCNPIEFVVTVGDGKVAGFRAEATQLSG